MFGVLNGPPLKWISPSPTSSESMKMMFGRGAESAAETEERLPEHAESRTIAQVTFRYMKAPPFNGTVDQWSDIIGTANGICTGLNPPGLPKFRSCSNSSLTPLAAERPLRLQTESPKVRIKVRQSVDLSLAAGRRLVRRLAEGPHYVGSPWSRRRPPLHRRAPPRLPQGWGAGRDRLFAGRLLCRQGGWSRD